MGLGIITACQISVILMILVVVIAMMGAMECVLCGQGLTEEALVG